MEDTPLLCDFCIARQHVFPAAAGIAAVGAEQVEPGVGVCIAVAGIHPGIDRQIIRIIPAVEVDALADLLQVADAFDGSGPVAGLIQGGQQHCRQNRDDGDIIELKNDNFSAIFCLFCIFVKL